MPAIDLVCWDFGDTLVDESFMRLPPDGVPGWPSAYEAVLTERPGWAERWELGQASLNDLVAPLSERLPMTRAEIGRHLRATWRHIDWLPDARAWVERLDGRVEQAVVTANPHEFAGMATACGLDAIVAVIVTSAELGTASKVEMARRVRDVLGLPGDLTTTLLIDNMEENVDEFTAAGGRSIHYRRDAGSLDGLSGLLTA